MRTLKKVPALAAVIIMALLTLHCSQAQKRNDTQSLQQWQGQMQRLSQNLSALMPYVLSPEKFNAPENSDVIARETRQLAQMAHKIENVKFPPDADPAVKFMAERFAGDMDEAYRQLHRGNTNYARYLIRNTMNHCISCHTRTDQGKQDLSLSMINVDNFSPFEKAQFYMAVRDFDKGVESFMQAIQKEEASLQSPQTLEVAAEKAMATAIRVKEDPAMAKRIAEQILRSQWSPIYLKLNAREWKESIADWVSEKKNVPASKQGKLDKAKALLVKAWKETAESAHGRAGLVYYLRASKLLHEVLAEPSKKSYYGEALYYAGLAAEALQEINMSDLHEAYYESCIRQQPYTDLAKKCYLRFEAIQLSAYSGRHGTYVPEGVRQRLLELRSMAEKNEGEFLEWGFVE